MQRLFKHISLCYCDWESAKEILHAAPACHLAAARVFRNTAKLDAIVNVARRVELVGFSVLKRSIIGNPISELQRFTYIGPVTVRHLAKNLGFDFAKPDRHLVRLSLQMGFANVSDLCRAIAQVSGETIRVVDLILWRYLADTRWSDLSRATE